MKYQADIRSKILINTFRLWNISLKSKAARKAFPSFRCCRTEKWTAKTTSTVGATSGRGPNTRLSTARSIPFAGTNRSQEPWLSSTRKKHKSKACCANHSLTLKTTSISRPNNKLFCAKTSQRSSERGRYRKQSRVKRVKSPSSCLR